MEKIKTVLCLLLMILVSSCRQSDQETSLLQDDISGVIEMNRKSADSTNATSDNNEIETYSSSLVLNEDPKFPPRK